MLVATEDPRRYRFTLAEWNHQHSKVKDEGNRSELHGSVEFTGVAIRLTGLTETFYTRETPVLQWRETYSRPVEDPAIEAVARAGLWVYVAGLYPVEVAP